jgi:hypothetical protein
LARWDHSAVGTAPFLCISLDDFAASDDSGRDCAMGLPCSIVIATAISSTRERIKATAFRMVSARLARDVLLQILKPFRRHGVRHPLKNKRHLLQRSTWPKHRLKSAQQTTGVAGSTLCYEDAALLTLSDITKIAETLMGALSLI